MPNRADFIADICSEINRKSDQARAQAVNWVRRATSRLNQDLRVKEMLSHAVRPISGPRFPVPDGFLKVRSLRVTAGNGADYYGASKGALAYAPPDTMSEQAARMATAQYPGFYTNHGREIEMAPWRLSGNYQADLWYYARIPELTTDTSTNVILEANYDLYLDAALVHAFAWTQETDQSMSKAAMVQATIAKLNEMHEMERYGDGALIVPPPASTVRRRYS